MRSTVAAMAAPSSRRTPALTRDEVVQVAARLAREHGIDGVTMRSVATELDVTPMALYYHVSNKEELVALIAAAATVDTVDLELGDAGWEDALRAYLLSRWSKFRTYPGLGAYVISLPNLGADPESYRRGLEFFEAAGFPPRLARLAWPYAITYIHGRLSVDANLDRESARADGIGEISATEHVEFGVDAVVAGLRAMLDVAVPEQSAPGSG